MTDILIPVESKLKVFVKEVDGAIREVSQHNDRLTATKAINRLNFVRGHRTGDYYFIEGEMN